MWSVRKRESRRRVRREAYLTRRGEVGVGVPRWGVDEDLTEAELFRRGPGHVTGTARETGERDDNERSLE